MIAELTISGAPGQGEIRVPVIRSARKSLGLEVRDANTVLARIPARVSDRELKAFVEAHRELDPGENSGHGRAGGEPEEQHRHRRRSF